ncbi:MAG: ABC transporter permease [Roseburia sp.]|nr:ABC transporter permease [Roseburia sp.]MCM1279487.1 ABC transporter permease [Robinsoniella sp.]
MWKNYSIGYIKHNRASGISIMAASFIAAVFLSFLCSLFYNFWLDNIEGTKLKDGNWHGRITGEINKDDLAKLNHFANVERAVINEELSGEQGIVVDVYFYNKRTVCQDMTELISSLGLTEYTIDYNYQLLSLYFIRIPGDSMPRLLMPVYLAVVILVCVSLVLVIHNSFAVSMNSRIHQFGIFSSIGAAPGQIRVCLLQEALILSIAPILLGILVGIVFSFGTVRAMSDFAANLSGGRQAVFHCHPLVVAAIFLLSAFTVVVSAWIPAGKLSRLTPLEAIRGTGELQLKKKKRIVLSALFGIEGELAGNACKAQRKALRTTTLSLTFAFLGFMLMQCFFTLSGISTNHTYFEAYQDVWDVMVTVRDTKIEEFKPMEQIQKMQGVRNSIIYQKAEAVSSIPAENISRELAATGGLEAVAGSGIVAAENSFLIKAPIVILDDKSFGEYCEQIGIMPKTDGTILVNRIWDSRNSNFRYRKYIPYITENRNSITLQSSGQEENRVEIPVLTYTQDIPALREEYEDYALVNVMSVSLWKEIEEVIGVSQKETYVCLLAKEEASLKELNALEENVEQMIGADYEMESENRILEKIANDEMIKGYELILGGFCVLLAIIGIAHVFSNALGFLNQRKREFARYMSVGMTPKEMRKMFCIEALIIAGGPALTALALTIMAVAFMIKISYLNPMEFIRVAPVMPISLFILAVFGCVGLAYYLGGKKVLGSSLVDTLRDDTMV